VLLEICHEKEVFDAQSRIRHLEYDNGGEEKDKEGRRRIRIRRKGLGKVTLTFIRPFQ
jgi:hypothetical protein